MIKKKNITIVTNNNNNNNNHGNNSRGNNNNNNNNNNYHNNNNNKRKLKTCDCSNKQQKVNELISTKKRADEVIEVLDSDDEDSDDDEFYTAPSSPADFESAPTSPIPNYDSDSSNNNDAEGRNAAKLSPSAPASASTAETSKPPSYLPTGDPSKEILVYPFSGKKASVICNSDVLRLADGKFLNDCIMDVYPKLLQDEIPRDDIHIFSPFFYTRLTGVEDSPSSSSSAKPVSRKTIRKKDEPIKYENVRRWTNKVDIFDKKHIIVPIVQKYHWFLAVITNPALCIGTKTDNGVDQSTSPSDCCITFLDSLSFNHGDCYEKLCDYLKEEATNRLNIERNKFKQPKHVKGRAPQQLNSSDCGVHCLQCIKRIYKEPEQIQDALLHPDTTNDHLWNSNEIVDFRKNLSLKLLKKADEYEVYLKE